MSQLFCLGLQSQPKLFGTLKLYHASPIPSNQCWIISRFSIKNGKNHLIGNIEGRGRGELTSCPNYFVWDCSYTNSYYTVSFKLRLLSLFPSSSDASAHFHIETTSHMSLKAEKSLIFIFHVITVNSLTASTSRKRSPQINDHFVNNYFVSQSNTVARVLS